MKPNETSRNVIEEAICNHCNKPKEGIQTGICNECGKFGKTNRELALEWWFNLDGIVKTGLSKRYNNTLMWKILNPLEIEVIYKLEKEKPNAKQFKQYDEKLFLAYINKFSNEDKISMLETLMNNAQFNDISYESHKERYYIQRGFLMNKIT